MSVDPPVRPDHPAPVCPTSTSKTTIWSDGFEADWNWSVYNWMRDDLEPGRLEPHRWLHVRGKRAMMADETAVRQWSSAVPRDHATGGDRKFSVPSDGRLTYLRFDHAYDLKKRDYDGARIEYSTDGVNIKDAGSLITASDHPYNGTISVGADSPFQGQKAFTGWSNGFTSTRVNLTPLGGKAVTPIFTRATDLGGSSIGWFIDNVEVYTCTLGRTSTSITAALQPDRWRLGNDQRAGGEVGHEHGRSRQCRSVWSNARRARAGGG